MPDVLVINWNFLHPLELTRTFPGIYSEIELYKTTLSTSASNGHK